MLSKTDIDVHAALTIHAFLLEIVLANGLRMAADPKKHLAQLREEFLARVKYKSTFPLHAGSDNSTYTAIHEASVAYAERFFDSLDLRLQAISGGTTPDP